MTSLIVTYDLQSADDGTMSAHNAFFDAALAYGWSKTVGVSGGSRMRLPNTTFKLIASSTQDAHNQFRTVLQNAEFMRSAPIHVRRYVMMPLVDGFPIYEGLAEGIEAIGDMLMLPRYDR